MVIKDKVKHLVNIDNLVSAMNDRPRIEGAIAFFSPKGDRTAH